MVGEQDVAGLDVAVHDPGPVRRAQRGEHAQADPGDLRRRLRAVLGDDLVQRPRWYVLHDDPRPRFLVDHVIDAYHVGMVQPVDRPRFAQSPGRRQVLLGGGEPGRRYDLLDRDIPAQHLVVPEPDPAHPAGAERPHQPVPLGDRRGWSGWHL